MSYGKYYPESLDYDTKRKAFYIKLRLSELGNKTGFGDLKDKLKETLVARNDGIMMPDQNFLDSYALKREDGGEVTDRTFYLDQDGFTKLMRIYFK